MATISSTRDHPASPVAGRPTSLEAGWPLLARSRVVVLLVVAGVLRVLATVWCLRGPLGVRRPAFA
ncbi:MAG: hypothetical protein M0Z93_01030 [Actinomycetota bacterium]|nr:hypothetical protein [Actinomycetota bacterium]